MKDFRKLCTPAKIYFTIAVIAGFFAVLNRVPFMVVLVNVVFAFIWTFVLGLLCDKELSYISWFLVLLPYIIILLTMFKIYHVSEEQKQLMRSLQLQGAYGQEAMTQMNKKTQEKKKK